MPKGVTIWFTGLSGSGKTTIARILEKELRKLNLNVEVLDGDVVRTNLSKGLGFSKEDRNSNIKRIGFVCHLLTRNSVFVIASVISPYREAREANRRLIGNFIEVYARCPLETLKKRDPKGLYEKAAKGNLEHFSGISDPYEEPERPDVLCNTDNESPEESAGKIMKKLEELGYLENRSQKSEVRSQKEKTRP
jgi:adenylylsulfate kinase